MVMCGADIIGKRDGVIMCHRNDRLFIMKCGDDYWAVCLRWSTWFVSAVQIDAINAVIHLSSEAEICKEICSAVCKSISSLCFCLWDLGMI